MVVTGFSGLERRLLVLTFDPATGTLSFEESFADGGSCGMSFDREAWPPSGADLPRKMNLRYWSAELAIRVDIGCTTCGSAHSLLACGPARKR